MVKFATHMGDPHGEPQTSPQHADPHGLGAFLKKTIQEIHVDRRVVDWSAGRHVDHPCGWQISPWPARKVTDFCTGVERGEKSLVFCVVFLGFHQNTKERKTRELNLNAHLCLVPVSSKIRCLECSQPRHTIGFMTIFNRQAQVLNFGHFIWRSEHAPTVKAVKGTPEKRALLC